LPPTVSEYTADSVTASALLLALVAEFDPCDELDEEAAGLDDCVVGVVAAGDVGTVAETVGATVVVPDLRAAVAAQGLASIDGIDEMLLICIGFPFAIRCKLPSRLSAGF
jgi:hypothetical protein